MLYCFGRSVVIGKPDVRTLTERLAEARAQLTVVYPEGWEFKLFRKQTKDGVPYDAFRTSWPFEREKRGGG